MHKHRAFLILCLKEILLNYKIQYKKIMCDTACHNEKMPNGMGIFNCFRGIKKSSN